uniref:Transposon Ty3-I Gag-Pol polyprotein n=1 Tax=Cajanus cajan TaxID=3821 RepID=A0A151TBC3_CAJCA|nr:Transposon Ty3-I Gag-Pol polyprotein [Cajanus cajan]
MPFGLSNVPSTFQCEMNDLLRPFLRKFVLVFFYDILIYNSSFTAHLLHLRSILDLLLVNQFYAKHPKCIFGVECVGYLGHTITESGVQPDPDKVKAIIDWPVPLSLTGLRGFLGITGFYRRFVRHYARIASPLTELLKCATFTWTTQAQQAFTVLKKQITTAPIRYIDILLLFSVEDNFAAVLLCRFDYHINRFRFYDLHKSCSFRRYLSNGTRIRGVAFVWDGKHESSFQTLKKRLASANKSLQHLMSQSIQTPAQQKWLTKLLGFDFQINYRAGRHNTVADALSRPADTPDTVLLAMSSPVPTFLQQWRKYFALDPEGKATMHRFTNDTKFGEKYTVREGLLYFQNRLFVPEVLDFRQRLLEEYHATPVAGHSGVKASLSRLAASYHWPTMAADLRRFIRSCSICQQNKYETQKPRGLLQLLTTPNKVWEEITMDFITSLPSSHGYTVIWVVCDRLSKYSHFVALPTHFTAQQLAQRFMQEIFRLHGPPKVTISDRDPIFLSQFWREIFKAQGTKLKYSSSYHPQTDGQTEVLNRTLECFLRCFVSDNPRSWLHFLHIAEFWYNTNKHSSLATSPFHVFYG